MDKFYYVAGNRIRKLREQKNYTREKLAEEAEISSKFLYEIEVGNKGFSAGTLYKISEALESNADYILRGESEKNISNRMINIVNRFDEKRKADVIEILKIIYNLADEN